MVYNEFMDRKNILIDDSQSAASDIEKKNNRQKRRNRRRRRLIGILIFDLVLAVCAAGLLVRMDHQRAAFALVGDEDLTVNIGEEFRDPGAEPQGYRTSGAADTSKTGDYVIEYSLMGRKLTRTVHVVDPDRIVLGLKGSPVQMVKQGEPYIESGAFATDKEGGRLDESYISIEGDVDTSQPGDYEITYTVSENGALSSRTRIVRVLSEEDYGDSAEDVPVMMYHWVYTADDVPEDLYANWILDTDLDEQLRYLSENEYYYPSWRELRAWIDGEISLPDKCVVMTFDDGKKEFLKYGIPLLEKYKVPATSFMICWEDNDADRKLRKYASEYVDYESHSYAMHQAGNVPGYRGIIAGMTREEILEDLKHAETIVKSNDAFAYPYGDWTSTAVDALNEQGILCSFTTDYGRVYRGMDPQKLPRVRVLGDSGFETWRGSVR